jgi:L-alanine-DL-glutamate epimerase-like enolase superfamily enzyme
MKITDLKCAVIGGSPVVRVVTEAGVSGYGQAERYKPYLKPHVLYYRPFLLDQGPTDVERVMLRIRHRGRLKPWGSAVSAIEMALRDIAGKAADPIVSDGFVDVWDRPGMGVELNPRRRGATWRPGTPTSSTDR